MNRYPTTARICVLVVVGLTSSPVDAQDAWELWREGRVEEAHELAGAMLEADAADHRARHLRTVTAFVKGAWEESLEHYSALSPDYEERASLDQLMTDAWVHLGRLEEAVRHARATGHPEAVVGWLETRRDRPWEVELAATTVVPFATDHALAELMPAIPIRVNGRDYLGHLDTGGAHVAMSPKMAESLGIETVEIGSGIANARQTKIETGLLVELELGEAVMRNVPIAALDALDAPGIGELIILGTNILQPFLVTWDNAAEHLILSPRGDDESRRVHLAMAGEIEAESDFYLYSDHFLFAPGGVGAHERVVFVDTGLVTVDHRGRQPAGIVPPSVLERWSLALTDGQFVELPWPVRLGPLEQEGHSMASFNARAGFDWHGMQVPILVAHGFLKNYIWTLDFENRKFLFRSVRREPPGVSTVELPEDGSELSVYAGSYELAPGVALEVTVGEMGLLLQAPSQQKVRMTPADDADTFEIKLAGAVVRFERDSSGAVAELVLLQAGLEQRARRSD